MAIDYSVAKHTLVHPGNLISEKYGEHMVSIKIEDAIDNGAIVTIDKMVELDQWSYKPAVTGFSAYIFDQMVDGTWLVVVDAVGNDKTALIYQKPLIAEESPRRLAMPENFYNDPEDGPVRGYIIHALDRWSVSEEGFSGTPAKGKAITAIDADGKLIVP